MLLDPLSKDAYKQEKIMADQRNPFFPFSKSAFADLIRNVRIPGFDPERLLQAQRRNLEALSEATRITAENMSTLAQRQCDQLARSVTDLVDTTEQLAKSSSTSEMFDRQGKLVNQAYERAFDNMRELSKAVGESNTAAFDSLSRQVQENIDELRTYTQGGDSAKDKP